LGEKKYQLITKLMYLIIKMEVLENLEKKQTMLFILRENGARDIDHAKSSRNIRMFREQMHKLDFIVMNDSVAEKDWLKDGTHSWIADKLFDLITKSEAKDFFLPATRIDVLFYTMKTAVL